MTIDISHEAALILDTIRCERVTFLDWDACRDFCDIQTGGALDCVPLDILTDMVFRRRGWALLA